METIIQVLNQVLGTLYAAVVVCQDWNETTQIDATDYFGGTIGQLTAGEVPGLIGGKFRYRDADSKVPKVRVIIAALSLGNGAVRLVLDQPIHAIDGDYATVTWPY